MKKYGKQNFSVIELETVDDNNWESREQYWIKHKRTLVPNGYNICIGGNKPPAHYGSDNIKSKLTQEQFQSLIQDLKRYELDFGQIASKYRISQDQVERINQGAFRKIEDEDYPLRKMKRDHYLIKCIIEDLKDLSMSQDDIEKKYQIKSRTRLYNINNGKVGKKLFPQDSYPIRSGIVNRIPLYLKQ